MTPSDFITAHVDTWDGDNAFELDLLRSAIILFEVEASNVAAQRVLKRLRAEFGEPEESE